MDERAMPFNVVYVNGRFLTQSMTGVQRYALEALDAIDNILDESSYGHTIWNVLAPKGTSHRPTWKKLQFHRVGNFHGHIWEQLELPRYASDGLLLTLCGAPSVIHRKHISAIHDTAIYDCPDGYIEYSTVLFTGFRFEGAWPYLPFHTFPATA